MKPTIAFSRRDFLRRSLLTTGALALGGCATTAPVFRPRVRLPGEKLSIAAIGCGGKGEADINGVMEAGARVVALCDVEATDLLKRAEEVRAKNNPAVRLYRDFRVMLEREKEFIDAVTISIPDHMHAPAAALAMRLGKHVYCQKPLTHTIWEARRLRALAKQTGVVTQMGNQGSATGELRRGVELLQAGVIGPVREVHIWTNRPVWPQGIARPTRADIVPDSLDWNLWLGVAPARPYVGGNDKLVADKKIYHQQGFGAYHHFNWRGWHDFGTGALGDMACHTANLPFRALNMGYATEVEAQVEGAAKETYPKMSKVRFQFPARPNPVKPGVLLPPLTLWWYDGGWKPEDQLIEDVTTLRGETPIAGCYFVGEKGRLFSAGDYGDGNTMRLNNEGKLRSVKKHETCKNVPEVLPRLKGQDTDHYQEWVDACLAGKPERPFSRFEIAAYLTEIILIGCIAQRLPGKKIQWDGPNMRSPNTPEVAPLVRGPYRPGWTV
ncbi:MAG: gfo/Idh/MocA family oxidoreductase [Verrucomicrobia bacterium]|nr:MAG: gfo/Idh/MocA family oxidoreductase [Verrucomicrobiota bacterium]